MNYRTKLVALLVLYVGLVLAVPDFSYGNSDAFRYIQFAENLSHGFYTPRDMPDLTNGPGYPLVILPVVAFQLPWLIAQLFNVAFMLLGVLYFHATLRTYIDAQPAFWASLFLGLYPPMLLHVPQLATETLTFFLICGFAYHFCRAQRDRSSARTQLLLAALYLGYLALTKVFFGYVISTALIIALGFYFWTKADPFRKSAWICGLALLFCLPYLLYTYSVTGRVFYWASEGGHALYWMSTPYENEYGSSFSERDVREVPELAKDHGEFHANLEGLSRVDKDPLFRERAITNIREHPVKYLANWVSNIGRILFSYPYSYTKQKPSTFFYLLPNMFLVVIAVLCVYPVWMRWRRMPWEIHALACFYLISFGGSSLVSAAPRMFSVIVPILALWMAFTLGQLVRIELRDER
ncbi:MAG: hypothetical protein ACE5NW_10515 [Acidiferrobacterales bacterium]